MERLRNIFGPVRVGFLVLGPVCVFLGYAVAVYDNYKVNTFHLLIALIGALAAHISVNSFNEYFDFRSGLDSHTIRTPFSGGSGTIQKHPEIASWVLAMAVGTTILTILIGIYFTVLRGIGILPIVMSGILIIIGYSTIIVRQPLLCLVAPGMGFGTLMVIGTYFVLTGTYSLTIATVSLVPFFLVSNLLLLNQFPDIEADKSVGRRNVVIVLGKKKSSLIYLLFIVFTYSTIVIGVLLKILPPFTLLALTTAIIGLIVTVNIYRHRNNITKLVPYMGMNVVINLLTPILIALGLLIG